MVLVLALAHVAALVTVPLSGGRLRALGELRPRLPGLAIAGLAVLVAVDVVHLGIAPTAHNFLLVAAFWLLGGFAWANRGIVGMSTIALGGAVDFLVAAANGGALPADLQRAHLAFLVTPVRLGDVCIAIGIAVLVHVQSRSRLVPARWRRADEPPAAPDPAAALPLRTLHALRRLGYIDDTGAPSPTLLALRGSSLDHLPDAVRDAVRTAYADVLAKAR